MQDFCRRGYFTLRNLPYKPYVTRGYIFWPTISLVEGASI
jgi:hypothetical protein